MALRRCVKTIRYAHIVGYGGVKNQFFKFLGYSPLLGIEAVPSKSAYNRFLTNLVTNEPLVRGMFDNLVKELMKIFPDFGSNLAGDCKAIQSLGKPSKKNDGDKRREKDADWGVKSYKGVDKEGKAWEKVKSWFGF